MPKCQTSISQINLCAVLILSVLELFSGYVSVMAGSCFPYNCFIKITETLTSVASHYINFKICFFSGSIVSYDIHDVYITTTVTNLSVFDSAYLNSPDITVTLQFHVWFLFSLKYHTSFHHIYHGAVFCYEVTS